MLGANFINTLTQEVKEGYDNRLIDKEYLKEKISDFKQPFYICGPPPFVTIITKVLEELGADPEAVVFEK